jgi:predicted DNA-binding ArsR family transcriptional regulator
MPYKIDSNIEKDYFDIVYTATVTPDEVMEAESKLKRIVNRDNPTMFLTDLLNAELTFSIVDLYGKPQGWTATGFNRTNKLALVA